MPAWAFCFISQERLKPLFFSTSGQGGNIYFNTYIITILSFFHIYYAKKIHVLPSILMVAPLVASYNIHEEKTYAEVAVYWHIPPHIACGWTNQNAALSLALNPPFHYARTSCNIAVCMHAPTETKHRHN